MRMLLNYPFPQGILLVKELIDAYGLEVVQAYMGHIQVHAGAPGGGGDMFIYSRHLLLCKVSPKLQCLCVLCFYSGEC